MGRPPCSGGGRFGSGFGLEERGGEKKARRQGFQVGAVGGPHGVVDEFLGPVEVRVDAEFAGQGQRVERAFHGVVIVAGPGGHGLADGGEDRVADGPAGGGPGRRRQRGQTHAPGPSGQDPVMEIQKTVFTNHKDSYEKECKMKW